MNIRSRDWCFTTNNYTDEDIAKLDDVSSVSTYLIYGKENAKTGTPHLQGYVYFADAKSFGKIQKLIPKGSHIEKTKGTPQQAADYCKKEGDFVEFGKLPEKQGKRNDLEQIRDMIQEGKSMNDVIDVATNYQSLRTAELLFKYKEKKRNWKPTVRWHYGETETGKTKSAYDLYPDIYRKTNTMGKWFEGYDGHPNVLLDDIKDMSREFYSTLLELLDRYETRVEVKGGSRQFLAKNIIVTSSLHPYVMYQYFNEAKELLRRIDEIVEFKN